MVVVVVVGGEEIGVRKESSVPVLLEFMHKKIIVFFFFQKNFAFHKTFLPNRLDSVRCTIPSNESTVLTNTCYLVWSRRSMQDQQSTRWSDCVTN